MTDEAQTIAWTDGDGKCSSFAKSEGANGVGVRSYGGYLPAPRHPGTPAVRSCTSDDG